MLPRPIVLGYHGCEESLARKVAAGRQDLKPSANAYDWLGHGIYFWAGDANRAREWARQRGITKPGVVGAAVDLGHCLHLADRHDLEFVREAYRHLKETCDRAGGPASKHGQVLRQPEAGLRGF